MKVAALDLGTNSFLCLIAEVEGGRIRKVFSDQVEIVRLGQDVNKTKRFHPDALKRAQACLERFQKTIQQHQPEKILGMATSAARDVQNSDELFKIGRDLGIPIEIIPGEKEAEITFQGSTSAYPLDGIVRAVIDIGGGSTEIIAGKNGKHLGGKSINIGGVRLTEMFFPKQPPTAEQIEKLQTHCRQQLQSLISEIGQFRPQELIAVAGTPTELAAASLGGFDALKIDGHQFTSQELKSWISKLKDTTPSERTSQLGISAGRADIILAGVLILDLILEMIPADRVSVSTRGVRFGVALNLEKRDI